MAQRGGRVGMNPDDFDYMSLAEDVSAVLADLKDGSVIADAELFRRRVLEAVDKAVRDQLEEEA